MAHSEASGSVLVEEVWHYGALVVHVGASATTNILGSVLILSILACRSTSPLVPHKRLEFLTLLQLCGNVGGLLIF